MILMRKIRVKITSDKSTCIPRFDLMSIDKTSAQTGPSAQET